MVKVKGEKVIASFNLNTTGPHFLIFYVAPCPQQATVSCLSLEQENAVTNMNCPPLLPFFMQGRLSSCPLSLDLMLPLMTTLDHCLMRGTFVIPSSLVTLSLLPWLYPLPPRNHSPACRAEHMYPSKDCVPPYSQCFVVLTIIQAGEMISFYKDESNKYLPLSTQT